MKMSKAEGTELPEHQLKRFMAKSVLAKRENDPQPPGMTMQEKAKQNHPKGLPKGL